MVEHVNSLDLQRQPSDCSDRQEQVEISGYNAFSAGGKQPSNGIWVGHDRTDRSHCINDSLHLWSVDLDRDAAALAKLVLLLSRAERQRASKFLRTNDRNRFIVRRAMLRTILARYLRTEPRDVRFQTGEFGKPSLSDSHRNNLTFNVSRSEHMALVALARSTDVGVDLERVRPLPDLELLIRNSLSDAERCRIQSLSGSLRFEHFYRYWTCKEACLKALAVGLNREPYTVEISWSDAGSDCRAELKDRNSGTPNLTVRSFVPFHGYVAATATTRECTQQKFFAI